MKETKPLNIMIYAAFGVLAIILALNQVQLIGLTSTQPMIMPASAGSPVSLEGVDITSVQSTAQGLAAVMALEGLTPQEVRQTMLPTGTPEYGEAMGVSFDDPVGSMNSLARAYPALKAQVHEHHPEAYSRWLSMAAAPKGMSCEFCCGLGAQAIRPDGADMCACAHHPALQATALWLLTYTDYTDAEVLREVYHWKTLFFPRDMTALGTQIAGGDSSVLQELPGMVGGC